MVDNHAPMARKNPRTTPEINRALVEILREKHIASSQVKLAALLGRSQSVVSRWLRAEGAGPTLHDLPAIEEALQVPRGEILRRAGYAPMPVGVIQTLEMDPKLTLQMRGLLVSQYLAAVEQSTAMRFTASSLDAPRDGEPPSAADAS